MSYLTRLLAPAALIAGALAAPASAQTVPAETPQLKLRAVTYKQNKLLFSVGTSLTGRGVVIARSGSLSVGRQSRDVRPGVARFALRLRNRARARLARTRRLPLSIEVRVHAADGAVLGTIRREGLVRRSRRGRVTVTLSPAPPASDYALPGAPQLDKERAAVGETVRCSGTGTYTWTRDGALIDGAARATYVLTLADVGRAVRCQVDGVASSNAVTAFNPGGGGASAGTDDFRVRSVRVVRGPAILFEVGTRKAGKVVINARSGALAIGQVVKTVEPGVARLKLPLRRSARAVLRRGQSLTIGLEIRLHPDEGETIVLKRTVTLRPS